VRLMMSVAPGLSSDAGSGVVRLPCLAPTVSCTGRRVPATAELPSECLPFVLSVCQGLRTVIVSNETQPPPSIAAAAAKNNEIWLYQPNAPSNMSEW
jgi:hypothetical protein